MDSHPIMKLLEQSKSTLFSILTNLVMMLRVTLRGSMPAWMGQGEVDRSLAAKPVGSLQAVDRCWGKEK